jgi:poly-beta-1,6-N-acetyl-D-glucosamine synthase
MDLFQQIILYFFLFVGIYFEVFILFTYIVHRKQIKADERRVFERECEYPSATIVVPVWNEETTVGGTIKSLLSLNYPKDKLKIVVVDDGSTDNTWHIIQEYAKQYPQIETYHKENGGKHTAVNYAVEHCTTELIGCLDADSFVDKDTLKKMACVFIDDPEAMAVTPAMKIDNPKTIIQSVQSIEYLFGILVKKVMAILGAIHVTPGPFTIFRRKMFDQIGKFRKAHNTEDMEIAFRMQANHLKIENVHNAWVYTTGPNTLKKLYKQRVRWTYGFLRNFWDYRFLFLNRKYGNIGLFTLPTAFALIIGVIFSIFFLLKRFVMSLNSLFIQWQTVGFLKPDVELSLFYVSTGWNIFLTIFVVFLMVSLIYTAQKLTKEPMHPHRVLVYFLIFPIIAPLWVLKSVYNAVLSKKTSWR